MCVCTSVLTQTHRHTRRGRHAAPLQCQQALVLSQLKLWAWSGLEPKTPDTFNTSPLGLFLAKRVLSSCSMTRKTSNKFKHPTLVSATAHLWVSQKKNPAIILNLNQTRHNARASLIWTRTPPVGHVTTEGHPVGRPAITRKYKCAIICCTAFTSFNYRCWLTVDTYSTSHSAAFPSALN